MSRSGCKAPPWSQAFREGAAVMTGSLLLGVCLGSAHRGLAIFGLGCRRGWPPLVLRSSAAKTLNMLFLCRISCKSPADMTSKRDHERDAELDKKIEALRRKNEALMKRYKVRTRAHSQRAKKEHSRGERTLLRNTVLHYDFNPHVWFKRCCLFGAHRR